VVYMTEIPQVTRQTSGVQMARFFTMFFVTFPACGLCCNIAIYVLIHTVLGWAAHTNDSSYGLGIGMRWSFVTSFIAGAFVAIAGRRYLPWSLIIAMLISAAFSSAALYLWSIAMASV
jgi:hypothetical protein